MPSGGIKIPGSLPDESPSEPDGDDRSDGGRSPPQAASDADDNDTESDEFDSDLDPETPHHADADTARRTSAAAADGRGRETPLRPPEELLDRCRRLCRRFAARGHVNNALRQLVRQTALAVLVFGHCHRRYAAAYAELARGYLDFKGANFATQAVEHAEHAKNILLGQQPQQQAQLSEPDRLEFLQISLDTFHTLGRAQSLLKKFGDAEQSLLKAEKLLRELAKLPTVTFDFLQEAQIRVWTALAKINSKLAKPAVAISYYEQAIAACVKRHGRAAAELVPLYQGVGKVEQSRTEFADHDKAIDMYLKAHEIATTQAAGDFTPEAAGTARALAGAYARCGSDVAASSAESYLQESLAAWLHLRGPEHAAVCEVQDELAKLLIRADRTDEGARMLQDTLKVKARVFGDYSPEVLESFRLLGSLWLSRGSFDKALAELQRARDIAEFLQGPASRNCREIDAVIATVLKHPSMEGKQVGHDIKSRPRFNGIVGRSRAAPAAQGGGVFN